MGDGGMARAAPCQARLLFELRRYCCLDQPSRPAEPVNDFETVTIAIY